MWIVLYLLSVVIAKYQGAVTIICILWYDEQV